jgi:integrase/recombinase XerD
MAHERVPLTVIQRQLGHSNLGVTSAYLQGIDNAEIIDAVHARRAPMIPVSASLRLCPTPQRPRRSSREAGADD